LIAVDVMMTRGNKGRRLKKEKNLSRLAFCLDCQTISWGGGGVLITYFDWP